MMSSRLWIHAVLLVAGLGPSVAEACSCRPPAPPADAFGAADAVFIGTARSIRDEGHSVRVRFSGVKGFKGPAAEGVEVVTASSSAACGVSFTEGTEYVVYASQQEGGEPLLTHLCSRTAEAAHAREDVAFLSGRSPPAAQSAPAATCASAAGGTPALWLSALILLAAGWRRRRDSLSSPR